MLPANGAVQEQVKPSASNLLKFTVQITAVNAVNVSIRSARTIIKFKLLLISTSAESKLRFLILDRQGSGFLT